MSDPTFDMRLVQCPNCGETALGTGPGSARVLCTCLSAGPRAVWTPQPLTVLGCMVVGPWDTTRDDLRFMLSELEAMRALIRTLRGEDDDGG